MVRWLLAVVSLLLVAVSAQRDETLSGCEVCATSGDCSHAYRGTSGQFCGNWLDRASDRRPCCCPNDAVCRVSNYACNCGYSPRHVSDGGGSLVWLWSLLGSLALLFCCCGCCFLLAKRAKEQNPNRDIPVAAPVASPGVCTQPYGGTSGAPAYYHGQNRGGGGMSAGTGAALGGGAGLLGGMMLGGALANHGDGGDRDFGGDFGGGDGGYGGGTGGGDYGGGVFGGDF
ncbi:hypothetical protein PHMEG_00012834 [Phytophthora megakarya]|uniref:Uncharacterized protein n=1 Tax=Phytophthora megakarya TaxID=4795 RepID=A0A225W9W7_9STRA|nr:hypothetical protein PHMEG_00012834 [Phytophthora megakarya]